MWWGKLEPSCWTGIRSTGVNSQITTYKDVEIHIKCVLMCFHACAYLHECVKNVHTHIKIFIFSSFVHWERYNPNSNGHTYYPVSWILLSFSTKKKTGFPKEMGNWGLRQENFRISLEYLCSREGILKNRRGRVKRIRKTTGRDLSIKTMSVMGSNPLN